MDIRAENDIKPVLTQHLQLGKSSYYSIRYLERASVRLYDSILNKMLNAFFAGMPEYNTISSISHYSFSKSTAFACRVEKDQEYYHYS